MKIYIIVPALNEEKRIGHVIDDLFKHGFKNIIVVDDGSSDNTSEISQEKGAIVVKHVINCGVGAATKTGFEVAKKLHADIAVTFDGDGQHSAVDIKNLVDPVQKNECEVAIGSRFLKSNKIPVLRRVWNFLGNIITFLLGGAWVSDSQSGLKAFSRKALHTIHIQSNGYEFCSEIMRKIAKKNLSFKEIPIHVRYSKESLAKGQNFANGIKTAIKLIIRSLMK